MATFSVLQDFILWPYRKQNELETPTWIFFADIVEVIGLSPTNKHVEQVQGFPRCEKWRSCDVI